MRVRTGGDLVVETLQALGTKVAFGVPGTHTLAIWEALRTSDVRALGLRTELDAGFAADGYARVSGRPAPLLLTTGPGALMSLAALMEAASAHVPVVAIASQIPRELIGRGRGYLHELRDQLASFEPVVKWAARVESAESIPDTVAHGWRLAQTPPAGPVFIEIPVDLLTDELRVSPVMELEGQPQAPPVPEVGEAARVLAAAERPVLWAGGGVLRSGAWGELVALAERIRAPVATTYMGKGAFPEDHPLSLGSACHDPAFQELLAGADAVLSIGTELGAETTGHYTLSFSGQVIQIDAAADRIGSTYPALGLVGDAKTTLAALLEHLPARPRDGRAEAAAAAVRTKIERRLAAQGHALETGLLDAIREALPRDAAHAWDMTLLAYWAAEYFPAAAPRRFLYPLGSGTLGYAWPAALGVSAALPETRVLAVVGDGGFLYGLQELAAARQYGLAAKLLLIDDRGYGILRAHQQAVYGVTHAVDLVQPDFAALCAAFGVPVRTSSPEALAADLGWALEVEGPAAVVLPAVLEMFDSDAVEREEKA
jgi:acetolactate synthase I/II/III large subunit